MLNWQGWAATNFQGWGSASTAPTAAAIAAAVWSTVIEGAFTASDLLRIIAAVAAGKTSIIPGAPGQADVIFKTVSGGPTIVEGQMVGSERTSVTITP